MRRALLAIALAAATASLLAAASCSSEYDAAAADAGQSPPADGASTSDAIGPPPDGAPSDAATDGGCIAMKTSFCDDFERTVVSGSWPELIEQNTGALSLEVVDGGRVLRSESAAVTGGGEPVAMLRKKFSAVASRFVVEADVGFDRYPDAQVDDYRLFFVVTNTVDLDGGIQAVYMAATAYGTTDIGIRDFVSPSSVLLEKPIAVPPGARRRVRVDMKIGGQTTISVDGFVVHDFATPAFMVAGTPSLELGVQGPVPPAGAVAATIDNLVFGAE